MTSLGLNARRAAGALHCLPVVAFCRFLTAGLSPLEIPNGVCWTHGRCSVRRLAVFWGCRAEVRRMDNAGHTAGTSENGTVKPQKWWGYASPKV